jgi:predicted Zn-ribbon and HTH transcriptional regulator
MAKVLRQCICRRKECGYKWWPRKDKLPKACPNCKHYDWNEEGGYDLKKELKEVKALLPKRILVSN